MSKLGIYLIYIKLFYKKIFNYLTFIIKKWPQLKLFDLKYLNNYYYYNNIRIMNNVKYNYLDNDTNILKIKEETRTLLTFF